MVMAVAMGRAMDGLREALAAVKKGYEGRLR